MRQNVKELLRNNPYPGRGIIIGSSEDGKNSIVLYFIMGRSENSRNRIFEKTDDGIRTAAFDVSKMTDPSLIIYHPVRFTGDTIIVTNGEQTNTIRDSLAKGEILPLQESIFHSTGAAFYSALQLHEFEPDAPNYTPRISGIVKINGDYILSVLKIVEGDTGCCQRCFFEYSGAKPGLGHFVSTYETDGNPLPSFSGEPIPISMEGSSDFDVFAGTIWYALNNDNKVSLYACERNIATGKVREIIKNKLG